MVLDNELQVLLLVNSFLDSWETLVVSFINYAPERVVMMNHVNSSLLNEETRRKSMSLSQLEALIIAR